ncbi:unnamed protein product [Cochlearia groenlandica]
MSPPSATAVIRREIDPKIWRACAGASVQIPTVNSRVYYFPQGHVEHCVPSHLTSSFPSSTEPVLSVVSSVELLADPVTDEVFAHLILKPISNTNRVVTQPNLSRFVNGNDNEVVTFSKILTPSDANNGGGFSVPRYCADSIFPLLDFQKDPPVQNLTITDIHGVGWDFRHIYRGTPRRHLFTTGWSKFVNNKKLIAGDSVVFMKKSETEIFLGVRRLQISTTTSCGGGKGFYDGEGDEFTGGFYKDAVLSSPEEEEEDANVKKGFRRAGKGKLTVEAVADAVNKARQGLTFDVVYYPTSGWSEFVVSAEEVEASLAIMWVPGMRVKMAMETEDSSRITWFQGTVSSTRHLTGPLRKSPWKQLQITWDEPEMLKNMKSVNHWQVEVIENPSQIHPAFPPTKRLKYPHINGGGGGGDSFYPGMGMYGAAPQPPPQGYPNPYMLQYTTFPAGMQGARHYGYGSYNNNTTGFIGETNTQNFFTPLPGSGKVSNEMNSGSPPSDVLSPNGNSTNRGSTPGNTNTIKLFGKTITVQEEGSESGLVESEDDGSKESSENKGNRRRGA